MGRRLTSSERRSRERQREALAQSRRAKTARRRANERAKRERDGARELKIMKKEVEKFDKFINSFYNLHNFRKIKSNFSFDTLSRRMNFQSKKEPTIGNIKKPKPFVFKASSQLEVLSKKGNCSFEEYCKKNNASTFFLFALIFGTRNKYEKYIAKAKLELTQLQGAESTREKDEKLMYNKKMEEYENKINANKDEYKKAVITYKENLVKEKDNFDENEEKRLEFVKNLLSGKKEQIGIAFEFIAPIAYNLDQDWLNSDPDDHMIGYRVVSSSKIDLVVSLPEDIEFLPERGIRITSSGKSQSDYKISDRDKREITDSLITSLVFAYSRVIYKIAPTINTINAEVSKLGTDPSTGNDKDFNYISVEFERDKFSTLNLSKIQPLEALDNFEHKFRSVSNQKKHIDLIIDRDDLEWTTDKDSNISIDKHTQRVFVDFYNQDSDLISRLKEGKSVDMNIEKPTIAKQTIKDKVIEQKETNLDSTKEEIQNKQSSVEQNTVEKDKVDNDSLENSDNNLINKIAEKLQAQYVNISTKKGKTSGTSLYHDDRKFLQISESTKDRIEFLILRNYKEKYFRPNFKDLDIRNIRKYDPSQESYIMPWGYMFFRILLTDGEFNEHSIVIYKLIDDGYNTAKDDKILKVTKSNHELLDSVFNNSYDI